VHRCWVERTRCHTAGVGSCSTWKNETHSSTKGRTLLRVAGKTQSNTEGRKGSNPTRQNCSGSTALVQTSFFLLISCLLLNFTFFWCFLVAREAPPESRPLLPAGAGRGAARCRQPTAAGVQSRGAGCRRRRSRAWVPGGRAGASWKRRTNRQTGTCPSLKLTSRMSEQDAWPAGWNDGWIDGHMD
jgi:hypothetical protein